MVYNRCVGTRYCSNNCPYKVRRFNFLLYPGLGHAEVQVDAQPGRVVRSRGVMEKCTYCVQRISARRSRPNGKSGAVRDGEIVTACQPVCPTEAIVFGDVNDPEQPSFEAERDPRNYALLGELNTRPRTTYLAVLTESESGELGAMRATRKPDAPWPQNELTTHAGTRRPCVRRTSDTFGTVTDKISAIVLEAPDRRMAGLSALAVRLSHPAIAARAVT